MRPASVDEVSGVLDICNDHGTAVVPQGGNTGLVGGSVPLAGELVLDLRRLQRLDPVDRTDRRVVVGAGVTLGDLQRAAADAGLRYRVDLAARDTATVGGTIATNAGGLAHLRFGGTRQQVLGIEGVRADGAVLSHLHGLAKDNTGYDVASLLCGSEGTLAVITAATLTLGPRPRAAATALVGFADVAAAVAAATSWRDVHTVEALELFGPEALALVCTAEHLPRPLDGDAGAYLVVEAAGDEDPADDLAALVASGAGIVGSAVATDRARRTALWRYREGLTSAINGVEPPLKLDVTVPIGALVGLVTDAPVLVDRVAPGARTWWFGHVGDGNVHLNVTGSGDRADAVADRLLRHVADLGGSISAEHGIGTAKRQWLHLVRSAAEIDTFRRLKGAMDPNGVLHPHALLPEVEPGSA